MGIRPLGCTASNAKTGGHLYPSGMYKIEEVEMESSLSKKDLVLRDRVVEWLSKYPWTWTWMVTYDKMENRLAQGKTSAAH